MNITTKYPAAIVELAGLDGDVNRVVGRVCLALTLGGAPPAEIEQFKREARFAGSYHAILRTCARWVAFE